MTPYDLLEQNLPQLYALSFDGALHVKVPIKYAVQVEDLVSQNYLTESIRQELDLAEFVLSGQSQKLLPLFGADSLEEWGYGGSFQLAQLPDYFEWIVPMIDCRVWEERNLEHERLFPNIEDYNLRYDYSRLFVAACSMWVLLSSLNFVDIDEDDGPRQLLNINSMNFELGMSGCSMSAVISERLCRWLENLSDNSAKSKIGSAMRLAYEQMMGRNEYLDHQNCVRMRQPQWIFLDTVGNACGLFPDDYTVYEGRGYKLLPHNVDTPAQQMTLVCGLAKLYELASSKPD